MTERKKISPLKQWMAAATTAEQEQLAALVGTTRGNLYQYVKHRTPSSERAVAFEDATITMAKSTNGRLPVIYRTDLNKTCSQCHFARKCLGEKADFELLGDLA